MNELLEPIKLMSFIGMIGFALATAILYTSLQIDSQTFQEVADDKSGNILTSVLRKIMYLCGALTLAFFAVFSVAEPVSNWFGANT